MLCYLTCLSDSARSSILREPSWQDRTRARPSLTQSTVSGLAPNERYVFALAFYDASGALIDTIGPSTPPITLAQPLPKLQCQAYLSLTAHRLGCRKEALSAASPVVAHFIDRVGLDEDGVEQLFGDQLKEKEAREAPGPLLRSFVQVRAKKVSSQPFAT